MNHKAPWNEVGRRLISTGKSLDFRFSSGKLVTRASDHLSLLKNKPPSLCLPGLFIRAPQAFVNGIWSSSNFAFSKRQGLLSFNCDKIHIIDNLPASPILRVHFSGAKFVHSVVLPSTLLVSRTLHLLLQHHHADGTVTPGGPLLSAPHNHRSTFCLYGFDFEGTAYRWNRTLFVFLWLACFT